MNALVTRLPVAIIALVLVPEFASAHADREWPVATVTGNQGETYTIFKHATDGIVAHDPVKLIIRDAAGQSVVETSYTRDLVVSETPDGRLLVFAADSLGLSFWNGWAVENGNLVPLSPAEHFGTAILVNVNERWLGYGFSVIVCGVAILMVLTPVRRGRPNQSGCVVLGAILWLLLLFAHGPLSILLIAALTLMCTLPVVGLLYYRRPAESPATR